MGEEDDGDVARAGAVGSGEGRRGGGEWRRVGIGRGPQKCF